MIEFVDVVPKSLDYTVDTGDSRYRGVKKPYDTAVQLFIYKDKAPTVYCKLARDEDRKSVV